jgi:predicted deacylase
MSDETIKVGTAEAAPGVLAKGSIPGVELNTGVRVDIPVLVLNGEGEGPTVLLQSTQHGTEIQGIEVIRRILREEIVPPVLKGAVVGVPVANPLAYMHHQYLSWIDNLDVGRVSAENPGGTATEVLAHALWEHAWSRADCVVNIHCNTRPDSLIYQWIDTGNPATSGALQKMAEAYGVTTIVSHTPLTDEGVPTLGRKAAQAGKPVILQELIDGRNISEPSTSAGVRGVLNILRSLGMIEGKLEKQSGFPVVEGQGRFWGILRPRRGGVVEILKKTGERIGCGEPVLRVRNLFGDVVEEVEMPVDGYIWAFPLGDALGTSGGLQAVQTGANVAYVFVSGEDQKKEE